MVLWFVLLPDYLSIMRKLLTSLVKSVWVMDELLVIMTPGGVLTMLSGLFLLHLNPAWLYASWLQVKVAFVFYCVCIICFAGRI